MHPLKRRRTEMPVSVGYSIAVFAVVAIVTYFTRSLPFVVFGGKKGVPKIVIYLGQVLPSAIIAVLIVYCLKSINITSAPFGLPEIISSLVVAALHLWRKNTLLSIAAGTVCYMILIRVMAV